MNEPLRIRSLTDIPALGSRVVAGAGGLDREVVWAHSCEMPDPTQWLGPDELLMTVGLCVPSAAEEQVSFIGRLDDSRLAAIAIGDELMSPPLSQAMLDEADRRGFPILLISHKVPFAAIGRTVAAANSSIQTQQMLTLNRLYRVLIDQVVEPETFVSKLEAVFSVNMCVLDAKTGATLLAGMLVPDEDLVTRVRHRTGVDAPGHADRLRKAAKDEVSVWKIPSQHDAVLAISEQGGEMLDSFTALHLRDAVAVEVDRVMAAKLGLIARGTQLIASILIGQTGTGTGNTAQAAKDLGLVGMEFAALAVPADAAEEIQLLLVLAGIANASVEHHGQFVCWINGRDTKTACELLLPLCQRIGVSTTFTGIRDVRDAVRSAAWALGSVREGERRVAYYGDVELSLLPRSAAEAREVVRKVLGSLFTESGERTRLFETLRCFLEHDRNWSATSTALGIHRQTLVYRLQRIEAETGRSLKNTRDLSEMWIACAATDFL
ncbi:PucR family transcriptional regulator [Arthrobacter sp. A5]|uniref:PucR family transcriptional regulator n=1 Tax=Arthrobacter sp. A5 TaxID=576926 RepID=UPI003DA82A46